MHSIYLNLLAILHPQCKGCIMWSGPVTGAGVIGWRTAAKTQWYHQCLKQRCEGADSLTCLQHKKARQPCSGCPQCMTFVSLKYCSYIFTYINCLSIDCIYYSLFLTYYRSVMSLKRQLRGSCTRGIRRSARAARPNQARTRSRRGHWETREIKEKGESKKANEKNSNHAKSQRDKN